MHITQSLSFSFVEQEQSVANCTPAERAALQAAALHVTVPGEDPVSQLKNVSQLIQSSATLSENDKKRVLRLISKEVGTAHGIRSEDGIATTVAQKENIKGMRKDNELYTLPVCVIDGTEYVIRGRIDRIAEEEEEVEDGEEEQEGEEEGQRDGFARERADRKAASSASTSGSESSTTPSLVLIEVKSRMHKLFRQVRGYEAIQIQAYLQMLPRQVKRARLVEQYMEETHSMVVERNDQQWNSTVKPALLQFCLQLHKDMGMSSSSSSDGSNKADADNV